MQLNRNQRLNSSNVKTNTGLRPFLSAIMQDKSAYRHTDRINTANPT